MNCVLNKKGFLLRPQRYRRPCRQWLSSMLGLGCLLVGLMVAPAFAEDKAAATVTEEKPVVAEDKLPDDDGPKLQPSWLDTAQVHGFATQGVIWTSDNRFFGDSPNVSTEFTELGINGSVRPRQDLLLSAQLLSRRAGDTDGGDIRLDFVSFRIANLENQQLAPAFFQAYK